MLKGKTTDSLMRHLRDNNNIDINGSKQKKELLLMGYYHGYKGYRFIGNRNNTINYSKFDEVNAVYSFDIQIKTLFYPLIMTVETAVKNYTLDTLVTLGNIDLESVFKHQLTDYKNFPSSSRNYKIKLQENLKLRSKIDNEISHKYSKSNILQHFLHNGQPLPLWAIFEIIDMGTFGMFLKCLDEPIRIRNCRNLKLTYTGIDPHGILVQDIIFVLKELRNAVAHNNVVFDCRFMPTTNNIPTDVKNYLQFETNIRNIDFTFLSDYLILLIVLLKKFGTSKTELRKIIRDFKEECELLRNKIPVNIWHRIVGTSLSNKLTNLDIYV